MGPSEIFPQSRIGKAAKSILFTAMVLQVMGVLIVSGQITMYQAFGSHALALAYYGITPAIAGTTLMIISYNLTVSGFYLIVFPPKKKPKVQKANKPSERARNIKIATRIIFILLGIVNVYAYSIGSGTSTNLYIAGGTLGIGTFLDQITHVISSGAGVITHIIALKR
jgi:hypothetical protein